MSIKISYKKIQEISLLLYLCVLSAHQTIIDIDQYLQWGTFLVYVGVTFITHIQRGFYLTIISKWYFLFMTFSFSSCLWAQYSATDVFFYQNRMIQLLAMLVCIPMNIKNNEDIKNHLKIILLSLAYTALLLFLRTPFYTLGTERMGIAIGLDANLLGTRMAIGFLIALFFFLDNKDKKYLFFIFIAGVVALLSGSKKALIMIALGICLIEYFNTNSRKIQNILGNLILISVIFSVGWYLIFNVETFYTVLGTRIERTINYILSGGATFDNSTREREYYILLAKNLFKNNILVGIGLNNFKSYVGMIGYSHVAYSHNNYWELLSCLGLIGTSLFYIFHAYLFFMVWKLHKIYRNKDKNILTVTLSIILLLYVICDYGAVSYMNIFQYIIITLIFLHLRQQIKGSAKYE